MAKFDMAQFLSDAGVNLDTGRKQVEYIPIDRIASDPDNFYELSAIDDLAENIALFGLQQPIVLRPMPEDDSRYIIVSGHRRHAAIQKLIQEDGRDDLREVMCIVERGEENPKLNELKLIYANASTRVISSAEQAKQAERVEKLLYELKEEGVEFPGRMRDHVAAACQMSTGKLARLKVIRNKLIPQFMRMWEAGELRESVAYTLAGQVPVRQKSVWIAQTDSGKRAFPCTDGWLENIFREMDRVEKLCKKTPCAVNHTSTCDRIYYLLNQVAGLSQYSAMPCRGCCLHCSSLASCKYSCEWAADAKKVLRDKAREDKRQAAEEQKAKEQPERDLLATSYSRVAQLRKERNITAEDVVKASLGFAYDRSVKRMNDIESGKAVSLQDRMPGGIWANEAKNLIATADLLGCSIDYLLGRADAPTAPAAQPEKCVNIDTWHTGDPEEPGYYAVFVAEGFSDVLVLEWTEQGWKDTIIDGYDIEIDGEILGWLRLPDRFPDSGEE